MHSKMAGELARFGSTENAHSIMLLRYVHQHFKAPPSENVCRPVHVLVAHSSGDTDAALLEWRHIELAPTCYHRPHFAVGGAAAHNAGKLQGQAVHAAHRFVALTQGEKATEYTDWISQFQPELDGGNDELLSLWCRAVLAEMLPFAGCVEGVQKASR